MKNKKFRIIVQVLLTFFLVFSVTAVGLTKYAEAKTAEREAFEQADVVCRENKKEVHSAIKQMNNELEKAKDQMLNKTKTFKANYSDYMTEKQNKRLKNINANIKKASHLDDFTQIKNNFKKLKKDVKKTKEKVLAEYAAQQAVYSEPVSSEPTSSGGYSGNFESQGVVYNGGTRYTWYSSNDLYHYRTGEWSAGSDGFYRDKNGYLIVASSDYSQGTTVNTPWGPGKVYDSGCASGTIDMYTNY